MTLQKSQLRRRTTFAASWRTTSPYHFAAEDTNETQCCMLSLREPATKNGSS
jgi:hypothetical protein